MAEITVIILTLNEELHIRRCVESVAPIAKRVIVVDSNSSDATVAVAREIGADVVQRDFVSHADQINWALSSLGIDTEWTMRLDADEFVSPALATEIVSSLPTLALDVVGIELPRRIVFLGRWIRHGGIYPTTLLRLWRTGHGQAEDRLMDEHMRIDGGRVVTLTEALIDENLNTLTWWTEKHNRYATHEAREIAGFHRTTGTNGGLHGRAGRTRWFKNNVYGRSPLGARAFLYFFYRYFVRLGFLDGKPGLIFHTLQGFWYRFLVDAKVHESSMRLSDRDSCDRQSKPETEAEHG